ncbi:hypothetical protein PYCCODRAFT_587546 [Trametes coccinea BRFM310]|uniref:Uncharacterized protein n=1 Tax=Trametes coccinea (strain BRFM310) TaxID=1353009 RepID=A0A1Y2J2Y9_TRAC3|nr:hypothetical protein PYCCODRAFT_587546 [Trametes coccinea BRFM310]
MTFAAIAVPGSVEVERAFSFAVVLMVQMFFVGRIWQLGRRHWYLSVFIGATAITAFVTGLVATVRGSAFGIGNSHPAYIDGLSAASAGLQLVTDIMINVALYWLCSKCKHDPSGDIFRKAFVNLINRGVLSTCVQS